MTRLDEDTLAIVLQGICRTCGHGLAQHRSDRSEKRPYFDCTVDDCTCKRSRFGHLVVGR